MSKQRTLVWVRGKDLRLRDHGPLVAAAKRGHVLPVFIFDPYFFSAGRSGELPHRVQYLLQAAACLKGQLKSHGSDLVCMRGPSEAVLLQLVERYEPERILAYRWSEPLGRKRDKRLGERLPVPLKLFEGETLLPPGSIRGASGNPLRVYSAFAKRARAAITTLSAEAVLPELPPLEATWRRLDAGIPSLQELAISANDNLLTGGEIAAWERLEAFLGGAGADYVEGRDRLAQAGTSRLSQDLKFGTISVRRVWQQSERLATEARERFQAQLLWREFSYHTLWDYPHVLKDAFRPDWQGFPWRADEAEFERWCGGKTGYPVVDAAARQLLSEGYVHNRARMIAASFLTKHLLHHYGRGEAHYLKYLVDGDWALNNLGWQWVAGTGCDAAPYFRVFNPVAQGRKWDPDGTYVRRYLPELAQLESRYIHAPWEAPPLALRQAGVVLGKTYPKPMVEHAFARKRYLELAKSFRTR